MNKNLFSASILVNVLLLSLLACSMGAKKPVTRDEKQKLYRPCDESEVTGSHLGLLCSRSCSKTVGNECKKWVVTVKNFCEEKEFSFFQNGAFIMIPQSSL